MHQLRVLEFILKTGLRKILFFKEWSFINTALLANSSTRKLKDRHPRFGEKVLRPYLSNKYSCLERVKILLEHYTFLEKRGLSNFAAEAAVTPMELAKFRSKSGQELRIVIRAEIEDCLEGEFTLSLENNDRCIFKICFTFHRIEGFPAIQVGAIQGPGGPGRAELVKLFTGELFRSRPRNFLFHVLAHFGKILGCRQIYLVNNESRICTMRKYNRKKQVFADYDKIWQELGATSNDTGFYEMQNVSKPINLKEVPSRKRSERRKREQLLKEVYSQVDYSLACRYFQNSGNIQIIREHPITQRMPPDKIEK